MEPNELTRGMRVIVNHEEPRGEKEAVVTKVPPFDETVCGETYTHTDKVMVQYPGTSMGPLFADMSEVVSVDIVERK